MELPTSSPGKVGKPSSNQTKSKPLKTAGKDAGVKCGVCVQAINDGKDEALFCEGDCSSWYHRYCAGVSVVNFQTLCASPKPFFCSECSTLRYNTELADLKCTISSLKDEVAQLKRALEEKGSHAPEMDELQFTEPGIHEVGRDIYVRRGRGRGWGRGRVSRGGGGGGWGGRGRWRGVSVEQVSKEPGEDMRWGNGYGGVGGKKKEGAMGRGNVIGDVVGSSVGVMVGSGVGSVAGGVPKANRDDYSVHHTLPSTQKNAVKKARVECVRRVWGTMKETTPTSLRSAIVKFCPSTTLNVKRKTIKRDDGRIKRWWFVLYDAEEAFQLLEEKWDGIQLHTGWKLEPCFRPVMAHETASSVSLDAKHASPEHPAPASSQRATSSNPVQTSPPTAAPTPTPPTSPTSPSSPVIPVSLTASTAATSSESTSPFLDN